MIKDMLKSKQKRLDRFGRQFEKAVDMVTRCIDHLTNINSSISESISEIQSYQSELSETCASLESAKQNNERVIRNFQALLNGE